MSVQDSWNAHRWARFHALPGSKRYPDGEAEYAIVLSRHNALLDALARGRDVFLVYSLFNDFQASSRRMQVPPYAPGGSQYWMSFLSSEPDETPPSYCHLFAAQLPWRAGAVDRVLRAVAREDAHNVFLVSPGTRWFYHPYDGGMDLILSSPEERDAYKQTYAAWLSQHPAGS